MMNRSDWYPGMLKIAVAALMSGAWATGNAQLTIATWGGIHEKIVFPRLPLGVLGVLGGQLFVLCIRTQIFSMNDISRRAPLLFVAVLLLCQIASGDDSQPSQELIKSGATQALWEPLAVKTDGLTEVPHAQVQLNGGFWGPRLKTQHAVTIPHALDELEKDGHVTNFEKAAGKFDGPLKGHHAFDSDLHKALEGALCSLQHFEDKALSERVDAICRKIVAAQQNDGFLISYFIVNGLDKRWDDLRLEHQMYNAGHYFEMAIAHREMSAQRQDTNKNYVIDSATKFADNLDAQQPRIWKSITLRPISCIFLKTK